MSFLTLGSDVKIKTSVLGERLSKSFLQNVVLFNQAIGVKKRARTAKSLILQTLFVSHFHCKATFCRLIDAGKC